MPNGQLAVLCALSRCATLEWDAGHPYAPDAPFSVTCNGEDRGTQCKNVFTLYNLQPGMCYTVRVCGGGQTQQTSFLTPAESACLDVTRFGAVGDGVADCTPALQAALAVCPAGGTVFVPRGVYSTGPLFLHSDMLLYLAEGAVLRGQTDRARFPVLPGMVDTADGEKSFGTWEGNPLDCYAGLLTAVDAHDVAVAGEGTVDGNAQQGDWWENPKRRRGAWRPRTAFFNGCTRVVLMGVTLCNSPSWTLHPYYCKDVAVLDVNIQNPDDSPNTDGCNPESCEDVRIVGTRISVGDDCIAIKSGKYYMGRRHPQPCKGLVVRNCLLERGHGAVVLGSEISAGVENLVVERCIMRHTDRGLRVKTRRGRGRTSVVTNIVLRDLVMDGVGTPFVVNMFYFCDPDGHSAYVAGRQALPTDEKTPRVGDILCQNITCTDAQVAGAFFCGLPEQPIGSVTLEHVNIAFAPQAKPGMAAMMDGLAPMCKAALYAENVATLRFLDVRFTGEDAAPQMIHTTVIEEERHEA